MNVVDVSDISPAAPCIILTGASPKADLATEEVLIDVGRVRTSTSHDVSLTVAL